MKLGRYRLVAELARGGMGVVWLAEARGVGGFGKTFILKELAPEVARDDQYLAMFLEEARVAARLSHKNVVQTIDLGCDDGRWFMVLELLEGCTLARAAERARIPHGLAAWIVSETLAGLHHAHEHGVVHRDVTPSNVFLCEGGEVKLLDFGLAKSRDAARRTDHGIVKGSVAYLSPDHVAESSIDRRADVFAAGVVLRELLTGERLWGDLEGGAIVRRLVARDLPAFPAAPRVPAELRAICERATAPYRRDRFPTALAMQRALAAFTSPRGEAELRALFDDTLAPERDRARNLLRSHPPAPPPPPVVLASEDLVTWTPPPPARRRVAAAFLAFATLVFLFTAGMAVDHVAKREQHVSAPDWRARCNT
jgi:serine/threonine-protein kinase